MVPKVLLFSVAPFLNVHKIFILFRLRPIDIETMKSLQTRVNVVPVISKADSLTKKELETLKKSVCFFYYLL